LNGTGVALTQLRPSGTAKINGQRVDVVTEGALIERGTAVKVVVVEGARIVVREI
jgi:membrane-bound serine protease (ClpP class)